VSRLRVATAAVVVGFTLVTGCSSSPEITMSSGAGDTVRADVLALTSAVARNQWTAADTALAQLRSDITAAVAAGEMSELQARIVRADVALVEADLAAHRLSHSPLPPLTSSSSSTPKPEPKPKPEPEPKPKPPKDDHGHGHGHGGDKD
jgi:outer membrane murein-binding lipoprotein Lpp